MERKVYGQNDYRGETSGIRMLPRHFVFLCVQLNKAFCEIIIKCFIEGNKNEWKRGGKLFNFYF